MKKVLFILIGFFMILQADDIIVFTNEYKVMTLPGKLKKVIIGNRDIINVSVLDNSKNDKTLLKVFGKASGNTSILLTFRDGTLKNYHVYVNQNLGFVQKMLNTIAPQVQLSRVGDGSIVLSGKFDDPHQKKRVYELLSSAGIDMNRLMDITKTAKVNKMIRTKLYLVEINNNKAKELGGAIGLGLVGERSSIGLNPEASTGVTFSGWLLDSVQNFTDVQGFSLLGTLKLLQSKGVAHILDDTVLITTEDKNASFHVGGDVYIPVGITQTNGGYPTIQLEEKEYGLRLTLTTNFMEKKDYMHIKVTIRDSEFDPNKEHNVKLGGDNGAFSQGIEVPSFLSKHITTDIVAKSKQVIALGGRLHKDESEIEQKIPLLGDIPIIGKLFTSTEKHYKANDLLFFLIPEIVDGNEAIDDSRFYEHFSKESKKFHTYFELDDKGNNTQEGDLQTKTRIEPIEIEFEQNDTTEKKETTYDTNQQETISHNEKETSVIPLDDEDKVEEREATLSQTSTTEQKVLTNESAIEKDNKVDSLAKKTDMLQKETNIEKMYEINIAKIFIRNKPFDGKIIDVWVDGHRFISDGEQAANSGIWLKIAQDCINDKCKKVKGNLWVSKKYSKEISQNIEKSLKNQI